MYNIKSTNFTLNDKTVRFRDIKYIESFKYYLDFDELGYKESCFEVSFLAINQSKLRVKVKFMVIYGLEIKNLNSNMYTDVHFTILCEKRTGLKKYYASDYEGGSLLFSFFCNKIEVISIENAIFKEN